MKVRIVNCTVCEFDYAHLIGEKMEIMQSVFGTAEWHILKDARGLLWVVSNADYEEVEENG